VAGDPGRRQRFEQEARAASALNHPNIISVYDTGSQDGLVYIVSELIEGESLRDQLKGGALPQSRAVEIAGQVADALAAAHAAGIVHRDLKPENIMLTRDGRAKILDFGLAKQVTPRVPGSDETELLTRTIPGAVLGTAGYMSPEQVRGEVVDGRSDIFSFGLVLYECLAGRPPFERPTGVESMTAILREDPPTIWVEPTVGGPTIRLTGEYIVAPAWSPDGNSIAGLMRRERPWQPAIVGVGADMAPRLIPGNVTCLTPLEWSPTGEWLACEARDGIQLISADGSTHRTLPGLSSSALVFARDGKTLYAAGTAGGSTFLKAIDVAAGSVREIARYGDGLTISGGAAYQTRISLSPDGRSLATSAVSAQSDLWLLEGYPRPWWQLWK
jgi:serine/threonine protein kinase